MKENKFFNVYMPVNIVFGEGRIVELGDIAGRFGHKVMMVTTPWHDTSRPMYERIISIIRRAGLDLTLFDQVPPNPTVEAIDRAVEIARNKGIEAVIGVGGGSALDSAKAIAVGASHDGSVWDYVVGGEKKPTDKTLPIITVNTTAGTGAHITQGAVITNSKLHHKSAIVDRALFPKVCIVDPELSYTMPARLTATTGFDAFTHAFESYIHEANNAFIDPLALLAVKTVAENLPYLVKEGNEPERRRLMSYADTLSGVSNANVGTVLPHAMGQAISGMFPKVAHGLALAIVYPAILDFTWKDAVGRFASVARIFDPSLESQSDEKAAESLSRCIKAFLTEIGLNLSLADVGVSSEDVSKLARMTMKYSDTYVNPRVPTVEDVEKIFSECF